MTTTAALSASEETARRGRLAHWRSSSFGPASEEPYRRRTSDWVRLVVAVAFLAFFIAHEGQPSDAETNLYRFFNTLPSNLDTLFAGIYRVGVVWAVFLVVVAALGARRWRLARDMAIGGFGSWLIARIIGTFLASTGSFAHRFHVVTRLSGQSANFPVVRVAIVAGVICVASPYLTRPVRRLGDLLVLALVFASLYLGAGGPSSAVAAVFLGWGVGAGVHLIFGSPGGRPTRRQVAAALAELGVPANGVSLAPRQPRTGTLMSADDGQLEIRVLGRDEADAQLLSKVWRFLLYKDHGPTLHLTRLEDVQAQAFSMLLAQRAGVAVPTVVVAGIAGPGSALLVTLPPAGEPLDQVDPDRVTDAELVALWKQVGAMHAARVSHGLLNARHIVLGPDGLAIKDFGSSTATGGATGASGDNAELLVSSAGIVGNDRAIAAAISGLGADAVVAALPLLQPAALSHELRPAKRGPARAFRKQVSDLRDGIVATTGVDAPPLQELYRVSPTNLLMAIGTLFAISALLSQVGDPQQFWSTITSAGVWWIVAAVLVSFATNVATAIALMGTVPIPLPLWRTSELQLSMSFSNLAIPAVGGMAAQIRFLQRQGVDLASAVASGGLLSNAGNILAQVILLVIAVLLSPTPLHTGSIPTSSIVDVVLIAVLVIGVVVGLILGVPKIRKVALPPVMGAMSTMWAAARSPRRLLFLLGGNALNALMYAFLMQICIFAFGGSINFWTLLSLNIFISTIASLIPVPGGGTAVSSVGMSGALTAAGVPTEIAVAAVLLNQIVANFLPAVPGWFATNDLLHHDYL
ncbi:MAG: hypothetical protein JWL73_3200 [Actinomycetia bacterium]|nr:hypothetical protein [Actinomycetes bacterium]